jgi:hypothetical protein
MREREIYRYFERAAEILPELDLPVGLVLRVNQTTTKGQHYRIPGTVELPDSKYLLVGHLFSGIQSIEGYDHTTRYLDMIDAFDGWAWLVPQLEVRPC